MSSLRHRVKLYLSRLTRSLISSALDIYSFFFSACLKVNPARPILPTDNTKQQRHAHTIDRFAYFVGKEKDGTRERAPIVQGPLLHVHTTSNIIYTYFFFYFNSCAGILFPAIRMKRRRLGWDTFWWHRQTMNCWMMPSKFLPLQLLTAYIRERERERENVFIELCPRSWAFSRGIQRPCAWKLFLLIYTCLAAAVEYTYTCWWYIVGRYIKE